MSHVRSAAGDRWCCSISSCPATRTAPAPEERGLPAEGWTVSNHYGMRCPAHRVDLIICGDEDCGVTRDRVAMDLGDESPAWRRHPDGGELRCTAHGWQAAQIPEAAGEEEEGAADTEQMPKFYWAVQPAATWQAVVARTQADDAPRDHAARLAAVEELAAEAAGQRQVAGMDRRLEQLEARDANLHVSSAALRAALSDAVQRLTAAEGRLEVAEDTAEIIHGLGSLAERVDRNSVVLSDAVQRLVAAERALAQVPRAEADAGAAELRLDRLERWRSFERARARWGPALAVAVPGWLAAAASGAALLHAWGWM